MKNQLYFLHALTATHVGIGQGTGAIDLPIAREKATQLPNIPGSSIKGVLRNELMDEQNPAHKALFGPQHREESNAHAGALVVGDAQLLCLPVRSLKGTLAYATCPFILKRLNRDFVHIGDQPFSVNAPLPAEIYVTSNSVLVEGNKIYLEELDLTKVAQNIDSIAEKLASLCFASPEEKTDFKQRFAILSDEVFIFLAETAMEIRARIKIDEKTGTAVGGALWYEENLPAETLLWGMLAADRSFRNDCQKSAEELLNILPAKQRLQIGGNATVGRGIMLWHSKPHEQLKK